MKKILLLTILITIGCSPTDIADISLNGVEFATPKEKVCTCSIVDIYTNYEIFWDDIPQSNQATFIAVITQGITAQVQAGVTAQYAALGIPSSGIDAATAALLSLPEAVPSIAVAVAATVPALIAEYIENLKLNPIGQWWYAHTFNDGTITSEGVCDYNVEILTQLSPVFTPEFQEIFHLFEEFIPIVSNEDIVTDFYLEETCN